MEVYAAVVEADPAVESSRQRPAVASLDALRRAVSGLGICAVMIAVCSLVWREVLDLALTFMIAESVYSLYNSDDRHRRAALLAGGVVAVVVGVGLSLLLEQETDFARDVACAGLSALAGSQVYAAVTRRP
ncbi:MAG TPA: hypothetical protein VF657_03385 [Actinoplanes sp.]